MKRFHEFIRWTLGPRVTPLAYLLSFESILNGLAYAFFADTSGVINTVLYTNSHIIGADIWGLVSLFGGIILLMGLFHKKSWIVQIGSMGLFMIWIYALIIYTMAGAEFQMGLAVIHILAFGYTFLSSGLGYLWDYSPRLRRYYHE